VADSDGTESSWRTRRERSPSGKLTYRLSLGLGGIGREGAQGP